MTPPFLGFSPDVFHRRRSRVRTMLDEAALILPAAPILHRSRDTEYRYRPDSELFYLTGCTDPGVVALLRDSQEESFVLFMPRREPKREMWSGRQVSPDEAQELYGADSVYALEELDERMPGLLRPHRRVFFRLGSHSGVEALVVGALQWARRRGARTGGGPRAVVDPGELLDGLRLVKDPEEISRIRRAAEVTVDAFRNTLSLARPGMGEWEVEALLESALRSGGGMGPAVPTIVGSGRNGCVLHYTENKDEIMDGQLVILDGGAEVDLYSGDVTRTYPSGGRFSDRQLEVYQVVLRAHRAAISQVRPGATASQVHEAALSELTQGLVELGVLKGNVEDLLAEKAFEVHFPHQTSHWLGLDVHDVGDYASRDGSTPLEPGMVLTVEPGLYFSSGPVPSRHPYSGMGLRIEDDLLVTEDGAENLTGALPVSPEEVEALVGVALRG
jgi:Xaa-Pro aminopeptidase